MFYYLNQGKKNPKLKKNTILCEQVSSNYNEHNFNIFVKFNQ